METRGYSAYEVAVLNGYTGTEQEWLDSLVGAEGPQGPQGPEGKSAYQVAVDNGYPGTEQEWIDSFLTPEGYYNKEEVDEKFKENYYDEITTAKYRNYTTDYYITTVPYRDKENKIIDMYIGKAKNSSQTPLKYAQDNYTSLTINATLNVNGDASVISNGNILVERDVSSLDDIYKYIGFKSDRTVVDYQANQTSAQQMLNDGCLQAFLSYYKIVDNGVAIDFVNKTLYDGAGQEIIHEKHPRQCLGIKSDKTIVILTCDGRTYYDRGLTSEECASILVNEGCVNAWNLDGGGSTSTIIKGSKLNKNIDNQGITDRYIAYTLNVKKELINSSLAESFSNVGEEKQRLIQQIIPVLNNFTYGMDLSNADANELIGYNIIGYGNDISNTPERTRGYFINIPNMTSNWRFLYNKQLYMPRDRNTIYQRNQTNGVWSEWMLLNNTFSEFKIWPSGDVFINDTHEYVKASITTLGQHNSDLYELTTNGEIKVKYSGVVNLRAQVLMRSNTSENKYISFYLNNETTASVMGAYGQTNDAFVELNLEKTLSVSKNDIIHVAIYGTSGDKIVRGNVTVSNVVLTDGIN